MSETQPTPETFDALFVRHQRRIFRYVAVMLPAREAAEEAFQQTCYVLLRSRDKFDPQRDFISWAYGVARNVVREQLRASQRPPLPLSDELVSDLAATHDRLSDSLSSQLELLDRCLGRLNGTQRKLVERCYCGGEKIRDVAKDLKLEPTVLYKRLDRIRLQLLRCIQGGLSREESP